MQTTAVASRRRELLLGPGLAAVAAGGSMTAVAVIDPNVAGSWPVCPSLSIFGVLCPLCGGLRSAHALTELDLGAAFSSNVFVPILVVVAALGWLRWTRRLWTGGAPPTLLPGRAWAVVAAVTVAYGVLRPRLLVAGALTHEPAAGTEPAAALAQSRVRRSGPAGR